ncbi:MAG: GNAT family N-acetyltransferase [bacterium]
MQTIEVTDKHVVQQFLELPFSIYRNDAQWVCPLLNDIESVFDPDKNNFFSFGKCKRWILVDENNHAIGRIAAFINEKKAYNEEQPTGGCGFFECIDDQTAANLLFDQAKSWLESHGMKAMNGPINFGENDMWWGLLVDGFTSPFYGMNYNPPYYKALFESYGFTVKYEQISNKIDVRKGLPEKVAKISSWVAKRNGYVFRHLDTADIPRYSRDFKEIYNDAWKDFENFTTVTDATIEETIHKIKPVMDPKLIWFAYTSNDEPVAFVMILPDTNELIKGLNGRLDLLGKLKFVWNKFTVKHKRMRAVIMGTKEQYRNMGLESCLFMKLQEYTRPLKHYEELELSWVGDFNSKMLALHEAVGATYSKKHTTYIAKF